MARNLQTDYRYHYLRRNEMKLKTIRKKMVKIFTKSRLLVNIYMRLRQFNSTQILLSAQNLKKPWNSNFKRFQNPVIMGHPIIARTEWEEKKKKEEKRNQHHSRYIPNLFQGNQKNRKNKVDLDRYELTVISSIYRPGHLFDFFLGNLIEQSIFDHTEIVLILVDPSDPEILLAKNFATDHRNVVIEIVKSRITIYQAWNLAIKKSTAPFITNMNIDDLRSPDSLETQVTFMKEHPWVDIGYQDFYYMLDRDLDWTSVVNIGAKSMTTIVSLTELIYFGLNPPHNAPVWKRDLHAHIGYFDETLRSAGDYDFWIRAAIGELVFAKIPKPTVGYFVNPLGMSTSVKSPSSIEERKIQEKYRNSINFRSKILSDMNLATNFKSYPPGSSELFTELILDKLKRLF